MGLLGETRVRTAAQGHGWGARIDLEVGGKINCRKGDHVERKGPCNTEGP